MRSTSGCALCQFPHLPFPSARLRGRASGSWMVRAIRDFAFEVLGLHRLELEVFSFKPAGAGGLPQRPASVWKGVRRDAVLDGQAYADAIEMAILEEEWRALKAL